MSGDAARISSTRAVSFLGATLALGLFSLVLALKDVSFKVLVQRGVAPEQLLFFAGLGALSLSVILAFSSGSQWRPRHPRYQLARLALGGVTWLLVAESFRYLSATSVAVVSKIHVPLLIVLGPWLGAYYTGAQRSAAIAALGALVFFLLFGRGPEESLIGYGFVLLAVAFTVIEYVMLRDSSRDESPFIVCAVPALSCVVVGALVGGTSTHGLDGSAEIGLVALSGFFVWAIYWLSIYRYRLLPLGISEYPSVMSAVFVAAIEYSLYRQIPSARYMATLLALLGLISLTLVLKSRGKVMQ